jgi:hypothetical protein
MFTLYVQSWRIDGNDFDEGFWNNEEDKDNEGVFSLHDTSTDCLF